MIIELIQKLVETMTLHFPLFLLTAFSVSKIDVIKEKNSSNDDEIPGDNFPPVIMFHHGHGKTG